MDYQTLVESTADAAFVTDEDGRIVAWNDGAEKLLGHKRDEVVGQPCHEVLCGLDLFGNRYCDEDCLIQRMGGRKEPVAQFGVQCRGADQSRHELRISVLAWEDPTGASVLVHLVFPTTATTGREAEYRSSTEKPGPTANQQSLTPRELEVLRLLADGHATQDVADQLFISHATARTHVQNILRKLEVHSQLEAVALAFRRGLI